MDRPATFTREPERASISRFNYRKYTRCPTRPFGRPSPITSSKDIKNDYQKYLPMSVPNYLTELQLTAVQSHLRVTEAFLRIRHKSYMLTDAPYGYYERGATVPTSATNYSTVLSASVDGLSGYLSPQGQLSLDRLRLLSPQYLALQQYIATESCIQQGNPFFFPSLALQFTQVPPICIYFPQSNARAFSINYSGLLLGPQARTQRELQMLTGTEIQLRGTGEFLGRKSSVTVTKRVDGAISVGDDDLSHARIHGPSFLGRILAMRIILQIISAPENSEYSLKQRQLLHHASLSGMELRVQQSTESVRASLQDSPWKTLFDKYKCDNILGQGILEGICSSEVGQRALKYRALCTEEARRICEGDGDEVGNEMEESSNEILLPPGA